MRTPVFSKISRYNVQKKQKKLSGTSDLRKIRLDITGEINKELCRFRSFKKFKFEGQIQQ